MLESLKSLANNIVNLFNKSKLFITCCVSKITIKVTSPKNMTHEKPKTPLKRRATI